MKELTQLQTNIAAILAGDYFFINGGDPEKVIPVLTQKLGDVETAIAEKLANMGLAVVIITPLGKLPEAQVDALNLNTPVVIQITEDPRVNITGVAALDVVIEVMCLLHGAPTGIGNPRTNRLHLTETPFSLVDESPTYHVNFVAPITLIPRRAQAAPPAP